jgi:hypothetical protein
MNAEVFAEWLRRRGYRVIRTPSSYWYEASSRVYQAFPYHWVIEPPEEELLGLLRENKAIALRYSTPVTASQGKVSYHVVCEGPSYELASLPRQARQNIRKGLGYASIEPIPLSRLATEGWSLRLETLERQGRAGAESQAWWRRLCLSAEDLPGFEAWGAIHDGELVASFLAFTCDSCYALPHEQSATSHLEYRVNNAIFYIVTHEALKRRGISKVFFCLQSLDAPCSVDEFKFRMGYTARPVRQRMVFHPWLAPLFNKASYAAMKRMLCRYPNNPTLAKAEGMLRFYLEGKRPATEQDWPECINHRNSELLEAFSGCQALRSGNLLEQSDSIEKQVDLEANHG